MKRALPIILLLAVVAAVFVILDTVSLPSDTFLWREIHNLGHTPLFGILSLAILGLSIHLLGGRIKPRWIHYALAFVAAFGLGLLTEIAQIIGPRDADLFDQLRNTVGISAFLAAFMSFDTRMTAWLGTGRSRLRSGLRLLAILLLIGSITPALLWVEAYRHRKAQFPVLCEFESFQERKFIRPNHAVVDFVTPPPEWEANHSENAALIHFDVTGSWPGIKLEEPYPDWRGKDTLSFDIYSPMDTIVRMGLSVEDRHHNRQFDDRFTRWFDIAPGQNFIAVALAEIKRAPATRSMAMDKLRSMTIYARESASTFSLYLDNIRLR